MIKSSVKGERLQSVIKSSQRKYTEISGENMYEDLGVLKDYKMAKVYTVCLLIQTPN